VVFLYLSYNLIMEKRTGLTTQKDIEKMQEELANVIEGKDKLSKKKTLTKVFKNFFFILIVFLFLGVLGNIFVTKANGDTPNIFGIYIFKVETFSMEPTIMVGNLIISQKPKSQDDVKLNDIVTFKNLNNLTVTHRIVEIVYDDTNNIIGYKTKGDNPVNDIDADILTFDRIIAIYKLRIPI